MRRLALGALRSPARPARGASRPPVRLRSPAGAVLLCAALIGPGCGDGVTAQVSNDGVLMIEAPAETANPDAARRIDPRIERLAWDLCAETARAPRFEAYAHIAPGRLRRWLGVGSGRYRALITCVEVTP